MGLDAAVTPAGSRRSQPGPGLRSHSPDPSADAFANCSDARGKREFSLAHSKQRENSRYSLVSGNFSSKRIIL